MIGTEGIILAAGYSSRAGTNKMLLSLGSKTVLECCIDSFYASCSSIYVVGGYRINELRPILDKYSKVQLIYNEHFPEGMFSSVKVGLQYIQAPRFFLTPGDYPLLQKTTLDQMLLREEPIVIPCYHGKAGHPVLLSSHLIPEILGSGYESLRDFIFSKEPFLFEVNDIGVITDIDDMKDYHRVLDLVT